MEAISQHCLDNGEDYPFVFDAETCGLDLPDAQKAWTTELRKATLHISTFRGAAIAAIHYYGSIWLDGVVTPTLKFEKKTSLAKKVYKLDLVRHVDAHDLAQLCFAGYELSELTNRFNAQRDILLIAKRVMDARLSGPWQRLVSSPISAYKGHFDEVYERFIG